jgi:hypothetical protein
MRNRRPLLPPPSAFVWFLRCSRCIGADTPTELAIPREPGHSHMLDSRSPIEALQSPPLVLSFAIAWLCLALSVSIGICHAGIDSFPSLPIRAKESVGDSLNPVSGRSSLTVSRDVFLIHHHVPLSARARRAGGFCGCPPASLDTGPVALIWSPG